MTKSLTQETIYLKEKEEKEKKEMKRERGESEGDNYLLASQLRDSHLVH